MPVSNRVLPTSAEPDRLRPYTFHGVALTMQGQQAVGDCPFCNREGKFSVEVSTGLWRCFVCGAGTVAGGGNGLVFTRLLYSRAAGTTAPLPRDLRNGRVGVMPGLTRPDAAQAILGGGNGIQAFRAAVARDRRLLEPDTAAAWGICPSPMDGRTWLVPGYAADGRLDQVYRRVKVQDKGEWVWRLLPTPGIWPDGKVHALHLPADDFDPARPDVVVCEGPWDGMALWEVWDRSAGDTNIISVPGCSTWRDEWTALCRGKHVILMYDSDHPPTLGGYRGMVRVAKRLSGAAASVRWLRWGEEGYNPHVPSGWDVRDELSGATTLVGRQEVLAALMTQVENAPRDWFNPVSPVLNGQPHHTGSVEALSCSTWSECEAAWREAMRWRRDLGDALAVLLAVCASTQQGGNQLFLQLVGAAGSGKTNLCDGLLVSGHCHHLEHLTGFHSGWKLEGEENKGKDCSLIARINGKTLVTPEADVLMSSPLFDKIMSEQRRIFDGKSGATYKNTDKDTLHVGLRTPWVMAGTPAMMDHDQSHLGDRFLRYIIADPLEGERRAIVRSALKSERVAMLDRANGTAGSVVDPKTRKAHALTGGYVDWLRANVEEKLSQVDVPESAEEYCIDLAELSADLRARPNEDRRKLERHDSKELPTRLARQNIRLASCLAVVLNKSSVDVGVLRIVRKVALDTAAGHSLKIVQWLCSPNPRDEDRRPYQECGGLMSGILEQWTGMPSERLAKYLGFLCKIGVTEMRCHAQMGNSWVLTDRVYDLYLRIMGG